MVMILMPRIDNLFITSSNDTILVIKNSFKRKGISDTAIIVSTGPSLTKQLPF